MTVINSSDANGVIDFNAASGIVYAGGFTETPVNTGAVSGSRTATITGDSFVNASGSLTKTTHFTITNLSTGLTVASMAVSADGKVATLTLAGNASRHGNGHDVYDLTITFTDAAFSNETAATVNNSSDANGRIDYNAAAGITYAGDFAETLTNTGVVSGSRVANLVGDIFVNASGSLTSPTHYTVFLNPS